MKTIDLNQVRVDAILATGTPEMTPATQAIRVFASAIEQLSVYPTQSQDIIDMADKLSQVLYHTSL